MKVFPSLSLPAQKVKGESLRRRRKFWAAPMSVLLVWRTQRKPQALDIIVIWITPQVNSFLPGCCHLLLTPVLRFGTTEYWKAQIITCATAALVQTSVPPSLNCPNGFPIGHPDPDLGPFTHPTHRSHASSHLLPLFRTRQCSCHWCQANRTHRISPQCT